MIDVVLRHVLALLLILGVGAIPLGAKASVVETTAMATSMAMAGSMADEMPCCPDDAPAMPDCQKSCPLLATCMTTCAPAAPTALSDDAGALVACAAAAAGDDSLRPSPDGGPPARPPRS